ncbi:hypothetical protein K438DRAFT_1952299 [Mycena galopus ATCC 62051]|nr:hypothetical protein K438DRAFT_1952299 [Mycena galopus ATCC 62051]
MSRCLGLERYHQYFIIATQVIVAALLVLRTYALYGHSKRVLIVMSLVILGAVIVGIWSVAIGKAVVESTNLSLYYGCDYPISRAQGLSLASGWAGVAIFDCLIFVLTLYKVFSGGRPNAWSILTVLLRDGSIYFGVMTLSNLSNILTFIFGTELDDAEQPYTRGIATTFTNIICSVFISRIMLNIRDPSLVDIVGRLAAEDIRFASFHGTGQERDTNATLDIELTRATRRAEPKVEA